LPSMRCDNRDRAVGGRPVADQTGTGPRLFWKCHGRSGVSSTSETSHFFAEAPTLRRPNPSGARNQAFSPAGRPMGRAGGVARKLRVQYEERPTQPQDPNGNGRCEQDEIDPVAIDEEPVHRDQRGGHASIRKLFRADHMEKGIEPPPGPEGFTHSRPNCSCIPSSVPLWAAW